MADWKQITARIRRARTGKDPVGQLSNLYEKTRDAMVAFELAKYFETSGQNPEAAKWYLAAAERFRRADWKTKAQEAAVRLGAEVAAVDPTHSSGDFMLTPPELAVPVAPPAQTENAIETEAAEESDAASETSAASTESENEDSATKPGDSPEKKRRRRGRRGGRNRRKGDPSKAPVAISGRTAESAAAPAPAKGLPKRVFDEPAEPRAPRTVDNRSIPSLPIESTGDPAGPTVRGRSGDPGLSSRLSLLEMQLRRLLTCPAVKLNEADHAPVGPGVFVLTDSDLTSYYYVESCQTLRIAIANLLRGGTSRRGVDSLKPQLAEHLGIPEARVTKYLSDHCVVRWLQLDEGASHFAHFVTAVIRPTLNE